MNKSLGIMLDCSRDAVMKPEKVKEFAKMISAMGYNMLQLYTEDTYEIDGEPFFGYMRGRYTQEELRDIDAYCASIGVELVPCIQVLAHLNQLVQWREYKPLFDESKLTIEDYVSDLKTLGFELEVTDSGEEKIYFLKGTKKNIKIITKNTFFNNSIKCFIGDVDFKKVRNDDSKLNQLIKDYRFDSFNMNYYQMIWFFYKYILETIEDYF